MKAWFQKQGDEVDQHTLLIHASVCHIDPSGTVHGVGRKRYNVMERHGFGIKHALFT